VRVLVVGGGAREHTIVWKLLQSPMMDSLAIAPGNGGTTEFADNVPIADTDIDGLLNYVQTTGVEFTIVGPEVPLAGGIVDKFDAAGQRIFGPTKAAARIESSKSFAKAIMAEGNVPTAKAAMFEDFDRAREYVESIDAPVVIKADGLAAGKGVIIAETPEIAVAGLRRVMVNRDFGDAGTLVVVEEFLEGPEISAFTFADGERISSLTAAVDYPRPGEGNTGANCGGMGSYSPVIAPLWNDEIEAQVQAEIFEPVVKIMAEQGSPYKGVLYAGIILTQEGPKVVEFNCRLGDPEAQVLLPRLNTDLLELCLAVAEGDVSRVPLEWDPKSWVGVVMASEGYPLEYDSGFEISGLDSMDQDILVFHAATKPVKDTVFTSGGRVLTVTASGSTHQDARSRVYTNVERIRFENAYYRRDIADFS